MYSTRGSEKCLSVRIEIRVPFSAFVLSFNLSLRLSLVCRALVEMMDVEKTCIARFADDDRIQGLKRGELVTTAFLGSFEVNPLTRFGYQEQKSLRWQIGESNR